MSDTNTQTRRRAAVDQPEDQQMRRRGVEQRAEATATNNQEAEERMAASTPTPTQEENDLAKVGALDLDSLQDDGSGPDPNVPLEAAPLGRRRQMTPDNTAGGYRTRAVTPPPPAGTPRPPA